MKKRNTGLSLVEILIAMLILAIAAAGLFSSFVAANKFVSRSKRRMSAVNLARQVSEKLYKEVRANDWNDILNTNRLYCPGGNYPCNKNNLPLSDFAITLDSNDPLDGFNPKVNLLIALVCDTNNPAQVANPNTECPRSAAITIQWDE